MSDNQINMYDLYEYAGDAAKFNELLQKKPSLTLIDDDKVGENIYRVSQAAFHGGNFDLIYWIMDQDIGTEMQAMFTHIFAEQVLTLAHSEQSEQLLQDAVKFGIPRIIESSHNDSASWSLIRIGLIGKNKAEAPELTSLLMDSIATQLKGKLRPSAFDLLMQDLITAENYRREENASELEIEVNQHEMAKLITLIDEKTFPEYKYALWAKLVEAGLAAPAVTLIDHGIDPFSDDLSPRGILEEKVIDVDEHHEELISAVEKYAFTKQQGDRFNGVKADNDNYDNLVI